MSTIKRRSRALVVTVIAASATLLIGATVTIVLLTTGLLGVLGEPDPEPPAVNAGECTDLCAAVREEIGTRAGAWSVDGAWSDAADDFSDQAAYQLYLALPL
ncbi:hypothetical protein [Microbacterium sp.]|uniref:hypothetical protein n=1 Tax=Microbacterium sp. TaxID=51671 RepID=UPI0039E33704